MMKKKLLIGLLYVFPIMLFSQNRNIDFGIKAGTLYSNFIDNMDLNFPTHVPADYSGKIGFHIGAYSNIEINNTISIQPELLISRTGSRAIIDFRDISNFYTDQDVLLFQETKANICEYNILVPILLNVNLDKYFLEIGPQFGYTVNRDISYKNGPINSHLILKNSNSEKFEFSGAVGFGYKISEIYHLNIRYSYGFTEKQNLNSSILYFGLNYKL